MEIRTIIRGYARYADAQAVATVLEAVCVSRGAVSLVAPYSGTTSGPGRGTAGGASDLLAELKVMEIAGVGPVVAAGWLVAALVAEAVTSDDLVRRLIAEGVDEEEAAAHVDGLRQGHTLVVARISEAEATRVGHVMNQHGPAAAGGHTPPQPPALE